MPFLFIPRSRKALEMAERGRCASATPEEAQSICSWSSSRETRALRRALSALGVDREEARQETLRVLGLGPWSVSRNN